MENQSGLIAFIKKYAGINFKQFYLALFLTVFASLNALLFSSTLKGLVDGFLNGNRAGLPIALPITLLVLDLVTGVISYYMLGNVANQAVRHIREKLWQRYNYFSYKNLNENSSGVLASRLVNDTNLIYEVLSSSMPQLITGLITIVGSFAMLVYLNAKLTLTLIILIPILAFLVATISRKISGYFSQTQKLTADANQMAVSILQSDIVIKSYGAEPKTTQLGDQIFDKIYRVAQKQLRLIALLNPLVNIIMMMALFAIIGLGGLSIANKSMTVGALVAYVMYTFQLISPISSLTGNYTNMAKVRDVIKNLDRLFNLPIETARPDQIDIKEIESVEIDDGSFSYPSGQGLYIPHLKISAGELVRLRGKNGSGKSTILKILSGMYDLNRGHFYINGIDRNEVDIFTFRKHLAFVDQNSSLLPGTIRDNLLLGFDQPNQVPDADIWDALHKVKMDWFVQDLPNQLDTEVAENGDNFSGGQRQRLAIARALIADCDFYFFDEITSDLDAQTKEIIMSLMAYLHQDRHKTVVYIDHDDLTIPGERTVTVNT
ncbi:ABC transporter ATP-binding protein [Leuconostocaceae bacterium ESL0723]|nr:ABC transporter ATP-binding protein [Leuconostocaceae bacterium ESL0723]